MRLLLTGGTGFFGKSLLKFIASKDRPFEVTVLSRSPSSFLLKNPQFSNLPWLKFQIGDVTKVETLRVLAGNERFTHLLHAALDSTAASHLNSFERFDQIVNGTRNLLELASQNGIKRFLLTSSGAVYGPQTSSFKSIPESFLGTADPLLLNSTYSLAHRMAEHFCALASTESGLQTVVGRCFAFVGEDLPISAHFAIGNFIRDAKFKTSIEVLGDGTPMRSYLYQLDLANWLLTLLDRGRSGEAYNVGSDQAISIADLAHLVRDIIAPHKSVIIQNSLISGQSERSSYIPNIEKARNTLNLSINFSLKDSIYLASKSIF